MPARPALGTVGTVIIALLLAAAPALAESLADVLRARGIPPGTLPLGHPSDRPITSYAILDDPSQFLIAYYEDDGSGAIRPPLCPPLRQILPPLAQCGHHRGTCRRGEPPLLRSVIDIRAIAQAFYLTTHITPSASCTLILSPVPLLQTELNGWFLAAFPDGAVIYHNSMVHFAPTHSAELSLYDPATGESRIIYPLASYQSIRQEHIEKLRAVYDDPDWCNRLNHHCDPERFTNAINGEDAVNDSTDSLAFIASFYNTVFAAPGQTPVPPTQVLYVYRHVRDPARIEYKEILLSDFQSRFGDLPGTPVIEEASPPPSSNRYSPTD